MLSRLMPNRIRVLLADAGEPGTEPLATALRDSGMDVVAVQSRAQMVGLVAAERFDVVVMDWRWTGSTTATTLQAIRRLDSCTPVILLAVGSDLEHLGEVLRPGYADFLLRPCPAETLIAAIENASERESCPNFSALG